MQHTKTDPGLFQALEIFCRFPRKAITNHDIEVPHGISVVDMNCMLC